MLVIPRRWEVSTTDEPTKLGNARVGLLNQHFEPRGAGIKLRPRLPRHFGEFDEQRRHLALDGSLMRQPCGAIRGIVSAGAAFLRSHHDQVERNHSRCADQYPPSRFVRRHLLVDHRTNRARCKGYACELRRCNTHCSA